MTRTPSPWTLVLVLAAAFVLYGIGARLDMAADAAIEAEQRATLAQFRALGNRARLEAAAVRAIVKERDELKARRPTVIVRMPPTVTAPPPANRSIAEPVRDTMAVIPPDTATVIVNDTAYTVPRPVAAALDHFQREAKAADKLDTAATRLAATSDSALTAGDRAIDAAKKRPAWWRRALRAVGDVGITAVGAAVGAAIDGPIGAAVGAVGGVIVGKIAR